MAKKTARKAAKGSKKKTAGPKRTANAAFMRPVQPDATVAEVVGSKPIPRTEVTKRLWAYIKFFIVTAGTMMILGFGWANLLSNDLIARSPRVPYGDFYP